MSEPVAYVLTCRPLGEAVVRDFFNPYGEVFALLSRPPETRDGSFGLRTAAMPLLHDTDYWDVHAQEAFSARTRRIRVYPDGTVVFRASADDSFLCWPRDTASRIVNPVVVADSMVSFTRFVRALVLLMSHRPDQLELGVELRNAAHSVPPLKLYAGRLRKGLDLFTIPEPHLHTVGEVSPRRTVVLDTTRLVRMDDTDDKDDFSGTDSAAFRIVVELYDMFGFKSADVPYVDNTGKEPRISIDAFRT
jgi:hypothetical protein